MTLGTRARPGTLVLAAALALAHPGVAAAADPKPTADDKCTAQCDEDSDRCMQSSGRDPAKQRQCDTAYDECLRKCS